MQTPRAGVPIAKFAHLAARFDANFGTARHLQVYDSIAALNPPGAAGRAAMAVRTSPSRQLRIADLRRPARNVNAIMWLPEEPRTDVCAVQHSGIRHRVSGIR